MFEVTYHSAKGGMRQMLQLLQHPLRQYSTISGVSRAVARKLPHRCIKVDRRCACPILCKQRYDLSTDCGADPPHVPVPIDVQMQIQAEHGGM